MIPSTSFIDYLNNLPADYCNRLCAAEPQRLRYSRRLLVLSVLLLACIIPRMLIALKISSICPDGVLYIGIAEALNAGRFREAFDVMNLNIYPVILMVLHRLGLSWEMAGMFWGVLISSLVVLPLYGWVRRQYDDTVALVACLLYAVQPIFIQWSPEIIRDPTFWFSFTLSLYLLWRAVIEVHIGFSLLAGLTLTLAVLTRFEGLFLLIPLVLWTFWRYRALTLTSARVKVAVGGILAALAFPALILLINVTLLRNYSHWVSLRFTPLTLIHYWLNGMFHSNPAVTAGSVIENQLNISFVRLVAIYVPALVKGFSALFALLMLGGVWRWRRVWARCDNQPLFCVSLAIMAAVWIHAWCAKESCDRYFLPIVIMATPFAALGLLALSGFLLRLVQRLKTKAIFQYVVVFAPMIIVAVAGWSIASAGPFKRRAAEVELAAWVRKEFGSSATIFGSEGVTPVIAYYAKVSWNTLAKTMDDETVLQSVDNLKPNVILLLATRRKNLLDTRRLIDRIVKLKYTEIERSGLPHGTDDVLVVLSRDQLISPIGIETGGKTISRK